MSNERKIERLEVLLSSVSGQTKKVVIQDMINDLKGCENDEQ